MTRDIFVSNPATDHSYIVPLRASGVGSPLFCFPGSGGNPYVFREMVAALPEGRPVFAIDLAWLCDAKRYFTIEQHAAYCLDVVRKIQKNGPYYFCGYSFGGLIAYEMAMRLINENDSASLVALLDTPNPALLSNLSRVDSAQFRRTYLRDRLRKYGLQLAHGQFRAFMDRGLAFIISRASRSFMPAIKIGFRIANRPLPGRLRDHDPAFLRAWRDYIPKRYPKNLVCFRVQDRGPEHDRDLSMGWDTYAMGGVEVHVVPGRHVDMMRMPYVGAVADKLTIYLDSGSDHKKEPVAATS
jgi:thioesterase domain-containing protein